MADLAHLSITARVIERAAFEDIFFGGAVAVLAFLPFAYWLRQRTGTVLVLLPKTGTS